MIESFITLFLLFIIWAIFIYRVELNFELKIRTLSELKRKCLVNMSKRRNFEKITANNNNKKLEFKNKKKFKKIEIEKVGSDIDDEVDNTVTNKDESTLEEGNIIMQNISKAIFKFNVKLIVMLIVLIALTGVVMVYSHLEISEIVIFLIAGISVVYLIAKFRSSRDDMKLNALESIKKKFKLKDEYIEIIKNDQD